MNKNFFNAKRLVIKIGSALLVKDSKIRQSWLKSLLSDVLFLVNNGVEVVIVSSGAIAIGKNILKQEKVKTIAQKQALAAVGQIQLMSKYKNIANNIGFNVAQILLTASDFFDKQRYENLENVMNYLLKNNIVPIINENDSVAVDEIKIGDNDRLAARVAQIIGADILILFSDIDGLYDKNPKVFKDAKLINEVSNITKNIEEMAGSSVSSVGTGGMITKITAAKMASITGCKTIITSGIKNNCLLKLYNNNQNFTIFSSAKKNIKNRKKWLSGFFNAKGHVVVNECAKKALLDKNASLLPIGVIKIDGNFSKGDLIFIKDENGNHLASGIVNYDYISAKKVIGKNSQEVKKIMGQSFKTEIVHINNLVII